MIYAKREDGTPQLLRRSAQMKLHAAALVAVMTCPSVPPQLAPALPSLLPAAMALLIALKAHEVRTLLSLVAAADPQRSAGCHDPGQRQGAGPSALCRA